MGEVWLPGWLWVASMMYCGALLVSDIEEVSAGEGLPGGSWRW